MQVAVCQSQVVVQMNITGLAVLEPGGECRRYGGVADIEPKAKAAEVEVSRCHEWERPG